MPRTHPASVRGGGLYYHPLSEGVRPAFTLRLYGGVYIITRLARVRPALTLRLYGVEEGELLAVQLLEGVVPERRDGEGLEVEQLGGRRVLLREDEVTEGDRQLALTAWNVTERHQLSPRIIHSGIPNYRIRPN